MCKRDTLFWKRNRKTLKEKKNGKDCRVDELSTQELKSLQDKGKKDVQSMKSMRKVNGKVIFIQKKEHKKMENAKQETT